jgi:hypothetical protein
VDPIWVTDAIKPIPAKPASPEQPEAETTAGVMSQDTLGKRKRDDDEVDVSTLKISKRAKANDVVIIDDDCVINLD